MGADGLMSFHKWKNHTELTKRYHRYVYPRNNIDPAGFAEHKNITFLKDAPQIGISSSFIRSALKEGKDVRYFLNEKVFEFIDKQSLYKK
jgi:nicotinate-nucleotide adenylyltransferase